VGRWVAIVVLAVALAAVSCNGDDSAVTSGGAATQPATEAGLRAAVTKAGEGVLAKDAAGTYQILSAACRAKVSQSEWASELLVSTGLIEAFAEVKLSELKVGLVEVRNVTDTQGEARFSIVKPDGSDPFSADSQQAWTTWLYEDGAWRTEDCGDNEGPGGLTETTVPNGPTTTLAPGQLAGNTEIPFLETNADAVDVVASGPITSTIPVVVHNGTDYTVYDIEVTATVRDVDGTLLATGDDNQGIVPPVLGAGDFAIGSVYVGSSVEIPDDATVEFAVTSSDEPGPFQLQPVEVSELNNTGASIVGVLTNTGSAALSSFIRVVANCFDDEGNLTQSLSGAADQDRIPAGGTGTFTIEYYSDTVCDKVLVGAAG
jgi:hypothetical protein